MLQTAAAQAVKYETAPLNQDNSDNKLTEINNQPIRTTAT
jgi:hypothetical protein